MVPETWDQIIWCRTARVGSWYIHLVIGIPRSPMEQFGLWWKWSHWYLLWLGRQVLPWVWDGPLWFWTFHLSFPSRLLFSTSLLFVDSGRKVCSHRKLFFLPCVKLIVGIWEHIDKFINFPWNNPRDITGPFIMLRWTDELKYDMILRRRVIYSPAFSIPKIFKGGCFLYSYFSLVLTRLSFLFVEI